LVPSREKANTRQNDAADATTQKKGKCFESETRADNNNQASLSVTQCAGERAGAGAAWNSRGGFLPLS
jgi:hypothetical protein